MRKRTILLALIPVIGLATFITTSSTSVQQSVVTVKPAVPRYTITKAFYSQYNIEAEIEPFIRSNVRIGYIVKSVNMTDHRAIVVMEKY